MRATESVRYAAIPKRVAAVVASLPPEVLAVARLCDGVRGIEAIRAESPIAPATTDRVVERLAERGLVLRLGANAGAFTDEEEAFFARPVVADEDVVLFDD